MTKLGDSGEMWFVRSSSDVELLVASSSWAWLRQVSSCTSRGCAAQLADFNSLMVCSESQFPDDFYFFGSAHVLPVGVISMGYYVRIVAADTVWSSNQICHISFLYFLNRQKMKHIWWLLFRIFLIG